MHAPVHSSLITLAAISVVISMPAPESTPPKLDSAFHQCKPVPIRTCARHFNMPEETTWYATFPNARGLGLAHSLKEFSDFTRLLEMGNYCSLMLHTLLCFHYFPPCSPPNNPGLVVQPCQEVCREATEACLPIARAMSGDAVSIPNHLDCVNFAEYSHHRTRYYNHAGRADNTASGTVISPNVVLASPNVVLACPNSSIHVDFSPPPGKLVYEVLEGAGSLEVCVVLANTGSYDANHTLTTSVSVHVSTIQRNKTAYEMATPGVDYTALSTTLVFPVGSSKWHRLCANVPITGNADINPDRAFGLKAVVLSPSSANFGGSTQSLTGIIDAVIVDDDGIHVDFDLPEGRTMYESKEDRGWLEICLELTSEYQAILSAPLRITLTPIKTTSTIFVRAERELDYSVDEVHIGFPVGSGVGHTQCGNVSISADGLIEADESFSIRATVNSPSSIRFAGSYQQTATVDVIIRDDDECTIPTGQCRRNCDMRDNASKGIFRHNCFDYAARVQLIRERDLQGCSALDVTVVQCWELQPGVCVANSTRLSIPSCQNCMTNMTEGGEYLIAGLHQTGVGLFLPNYKKAGLIGEWNDRKYGSIGDWVQFGINFRTPDSDCDG